MGVGVHQDLLCLVDDQGSWRFQWDDLQIDPNGCSAVQGPWRLEASIESPQAVGRGLADGVSIRGLEIGLRLVNLGASRTIVSWRALNVAIAPQSVGPSGHDLWSYCGASHPERPDWLRPVVPGFSESGWLGMADSDYGGGNPVSVVWNSGGAVAVGCLSLHPEVLAFPIEREGSGPVSISVGGRVGPGSGPLPSVAPGESWSIPPLWMATTDSDGLTLLTAWRLAMEARGVVTGEPSALSREPTWCAWGYERGFTLAQVEGALAKVADLGIPWVTLDDGWQSEEGDVTLNPAKFPGGESQMRAFVDGVHSQGLKAMLWWIPLAADPASRWFGEHPDTVIRDASGEPSLVTWWDNWTLCPSHPQVRDEVRRQLKLFFEDWGFDGLKIDGQHLNAVPPCHDPSHHHDGVLQPHREFPAFWQLVKETAEEFRPGSTILFCPCGTTYSYHTMPHFDVPVASDPSGSWQVRTKGAVFKALMGPSCAFHGDHVELSDRERDFASTVGLGGQIDTKFTWPVGSGNPSVLKPGGTFDLLPEAETRLRGWLEAVRREGVDRAEAVFGTTRFGFDQVETYVFAAEGRRYYSFFALAGPGEDSLSAAWSGGLEFPGLPSGTWTVTAWAEGGDVVLRSLGTVSAQAPRLEVSFSGSLLTRLELS